VGFKRENELVAAGETELARASTAIPWTGWGVVIAVLA
jgi:hypothetical protein